MDADELDFCCDEFDLYGEEPSEASRLGYGDKDDDDDGGDDCDDSASVVPSPASSVSSTSSSYSFKAPQSRFNRGTNRFNPFKKKVKEDEDDEVKDEEETRVEVESKGALSKKVTDHYLAYTSHLQRVWASDIMDLLASPTNALLARVCLLAGCAGAGKTYAINILREAAGPYCAVTASTLNAAGIHADSRTIHSYLGFNTTELLDLNSSDQEWFAEYKKRHKDTFDMLQQAHKAYIAKPNHDCPSLRMRCAKCQAWMSEPDDRGSGFDTIQSQAFTGPARLPLLIIDEYGMLTGGMLARVLIALKLWAPPGDQHLVVLVGSVTQLQPGRGVEDRDRPDDGLWTFGKWDQVTASRFNLPFSVRSIEDSEYSECLDMLQLNVSTVRFQEIMQSRVNNCDRFGPHTPRVMHQDNAVRQLNDASLKNTDGEQRTFMPKVNHNNVQNPVERKKFFAVVRQRFKHINFFDGVVVKVGSLVCVLKYQPQNFEGCLGVVEEVSPAVRVRSLESGNVHNIGVCVFNFDRMRTVELMPLKLAHGMNTYFCQGLTFKFPVVYAPPAYYAMSPIKPSCYVVCTRVTNRGLLNLTNCSFANTPTGQTCYFSPPCVRFKLDSELGYRLDKNAVFNDAPDPSQSSKFKKNWRR
ncbi:putative helicase-primase helicase subunit [Cyprinid herpesvirus 3]|uniref:Uncharacterized protein n=1 Tax=Cyprinid herpesvirus 3 TaxID=180230 RepID=A4FT87_CYHV3|nr:putative helicase-primase helicase subunit [Cyprinid herpesvirus 3]AOO32792.1 putative helicase-primase helicase subunit [Cyprinid herpesvirus 3]AOO32949.1 putative helicase-primase helicase subunit [Cyprinid herpesvirus 3]AOO33104.1 putative helicase-primase helicase subunit [Cyprinid herpesvirus 3]AOO33261.1 putative helicase-primase helicase subunit [Cyprinid herpesvirus 3]